MYLLICNLLEFEKKKKKNKKINKISNVSTHHSSIKEAIDLRGPRWLNELGR
jgi:hypothetical protein